MRNFSIGFSNTTFKSAQVAGIIKNLYTSKPDKKMILKTTLALVPPDTKINWINTTAQFSGASKSSIIAGDHMLLAVEALNPLLVITIILTTIYYKSDKLMNVLTTFQLRFLE